MKKLLLLFLLPFCLNANAQTGKEQALESLGALSGLLMYNTYITIGAIADGLACEGYEPKYVSELMDEQTSSMDNISEQLNALLTSGFLSDPSDKEFVSEIVTTFGLLKNEALYLKNFANGSESASESYERYRNEAWAKISELLGIQE